MNPVFNGKYKFLIIRHVPSPPPVSYPVGTIVDGINVLQLHQFVARYPSINNYALRWNYDYSRHAEVVLIDHLIKIGRSSSEIGISKLCCLSCYDWIEKINSMSRWRKWIVSGTHGKTYLWLNDDS